MQTAAEDGDPDALYCLACLAERLEATKKLQPEAADSSSGRQLPWKLPAPASLHLPSSDTGSYGLFRSASDAGAFNVALDGLSSQPVKIKNDLIEIWS